MLLVEKRRDVEGIPEDMYETDLQLYKPSRENRRQQKRCPVTLTESRFFQAAWIPNEENLQRLNRMKETLEPPMSSSVRMSKQASMRVPDCLCVLTQCTCELLFFFLTYYYFIQLLNRGNNFNDYDYNNYYHNINIHKENNNQLPTTTKHSR